MEPIKWGKAIPMCLYLSRHRQLVNREETNLLYVPLTSMKKPFTDSLCDIEGQPFRRAPCQYISTT